MDGWDEWVRARVEEGRSRRGGGARQKARETVRKVKEREGVKPKARKEGRAEGKRRRGKRGRSRQKEGVRAREGGGGKGVSIRLRG